MKINKIMNKIYKKIMNFKIQPSEKKEDPTDDDN